MSMRRLNDRLSGSTALSMDGVVDKLVHLVRGSHGEESSACDFSNLFVVGCLQDLSVDIFRQFAVTLHLCHIAKLNREIGHWIEKQLPLDASFCLIPLLVGPEDAFQIVQHAKQNGFVGSRIKMAGLELCTGTRNLSEQCSAISFAQYSTGERIHKEISIVPVLNQEVTRKIDARDRQIQTLSYADMEHCQCDGNPATGINNPV